GGFRVHICVNRASLDAGSGAELPTEVLQNEARHSAIEISEVVCQIRVVDLREPVPTEFAVAGEWAFTQKVIPERLRTQAGDDLHRLNDVAESLTQFLYFARIFVLAVHEPVCEHRLRGWKIGGQEHCRPQRAVKASNILADDVQIGRPP